MASTFGSLLRRLRVAAGFSQEALAERAGISANAVGAYEQGARSNPRRVTVDLLVSALALSGETRAEFESVAARRPARAPAEPDDNLPWQPTSFIGRSREIEDVTELLAQRRLVTVTGAGGIGKTRFSIELAGRLPARPPDGIWFVDLAAVSDEAAALAKISSACNLRVPERDDALNTIVTELKGRDMLLLLDNCEHVIAATRTIAEAILQTCPSVALLATSRERLGVSGERAYQLATLPVPDALELFAERAAAAKHDFVFSDDHVEAALDICSRLDGIALAIELAAARLPILGLAELRTQLAKHFHVLAGGSHSLPARQQTLHAMISWSHDLLDEAERVLFRRLSIFVGGWTVEAAATVCAGGALEKAAILNALLSLAEKSLVVVDLGATTARYSFFESTRAFALERLVAGPDGPELAREHARWVAALAESAYERFATTPRRRWENSVTPEFGNAVAALEWALDSGGEDDLLAARIAGGLRGLWGHAGLAQYGTRFVDAALERISEERDPALVARLLLTKAGFLPPSGMLDVMARAIPLLERTAERRSAAMCYGYLAHALTQDGKFSGAVEAYDRASGLLHEDKLQRSTLHTGVLTGRGMVFFRQGRLDEAKTTLEQALALAIDIEDEWSISVCQTNLAEVEFARGDARRAIELVEAALAGAREARGTYREHCSLCNLACFKLVAGDIDAAEVCAREVLVFAGTANAVVVHIAAQYLAAVAALRGQPERAARLLGYVNAWCERVRYQRDPTEQKGYDILMESLRAQLPEDEIAAFAALGAQLAEGDALEELG